ncbi:MAG: 3-dehydroquinate synthase [Azospirillum sp.]|nr:3-dehydroquinate synthase [Azospirillum sp.]
MTIDTVRVDLASRSYDILVGDGVLAAAGEHLCRALGRRPLVIVTDQRVAGLHLPALQASLAAAGFGGGAAVILPPGEMTKDFSHLQQLVDGLLERGIERGTVVVALGGGVIGDLVGFAAAVTLRGLDFVQVPTTLLAQVDSSVGGKTGINSHHGKNLIGAFHQPRLVLADIGTLETLEPRQVRAGYAEIVKYGLIGDPDFFAWLESHGLALIAGDSTARRRAVVTSCRAKAAIVGRDERESGDRALLNLGHTFGHALEVTAGYGDRLLHGEAVAIGMVLAFELSARLGLAPAADVLRVKAHLFEAGLPTSPAEIAGIAWNAGALQAHMAHDKKVKDGRITFVLARGIGRAILTRDVDPAEVLAVLEGAVRG